METGKVIEIIKLLEENCINVWIDGGWGIDALLGTQTRTHQDLDIVIQNTYIPKLRELFNNIGYKEIIRDDTSAWNFVLGNELGHLVDVHVIAFDNQGNGLYGPMENGIMYPANSLTGVGLIGELKVKCLTPEYQIKSHTGYKLREIDFQDIKALCHRFKLKIPEELSVIT